MQAKKQSIILILAIVGCVVLAATYSINRMSKSNDEPESTITESESIDVAKANKKYEILRSHNGKVYKGQVLTEHGLVPEDMNPIGDLENAIIVYEPEPNNTHINQANE